MQRKNKNLCFFFIILFFIIFFFINESKVFAASINFSPDKGTYRVGDTIRIKINVASDKSMNATSVNISFPKDLLSITSLSKNSSIVNLWAQEPTFSNSGGFVSFEGVILNGYTGNSGNIITLVFKAKSVGGAIIKFTNVSILANDGEGTEIFSGGLSTGILNIEKAIEVQKTEEKSTIEETTKKIENVVEKIKEVEVSNDLPNNSLLITIIILLIVLINFIIIFAFFFFFKLKKHIKNKLSKVEVIIDRNFKNLEKNINSELIEQNRSENAKITINQGDKVLEEAVDTEGEIIKEVEEIKEEI